MTADATEITMETFTEDPAPYLRAVPTKPIALTKSGQPFAYVVSADFYRKAKEAIDALHGHRRIITRDSISDEELATINGFHPSDAELENGQWQRD